MKKFATVFLVTLTVMVLTGGVIFGTALAKGANSASPATSTSTAHKFKSQGTGTESSLSPSDCQNQPAPAGCTVQTNGTASTSLAGLTFGTGPYLSDVTVFWSEAYQNPNVSGAYCARSAGPSQLVDANGYSLDITNYGVVCETQPTGPGVPHTFDGRFIVFGGTGPYLKATGSGTFTGGDDGKGNSYYIAKGTVNTAS